MQDVAWQGLPDLPDDANAPCSVSPSFHFEAGTQGDKSASSMAVMLDFSLG